MLARAKVLDVFFFQFCPHPKTIPLFNGSFLWCGGSRREAQMMCGFYFMHKTLVEFACMLMSIHNVTWCPFQRWLVQWHSLLLRYWCNVVRWLQQWNAWMVLWGVVDVTMRVVIGQTMCNIHRSKSCFGVEVLLHKSQQLLLLHISSARFSNDDLHFSYIISSSKTPWLYDAQVKRMYCLNTTSSENRCNGPVLCARFHIHKRHVDT